MEVIKDIAFSLPRKSYEFVKTSCKHASFACDEVLLSLPTTTLLLFQIFSPPLLSSHHPSNSLPLPSRQSQADLPGRVANYHFQWRPGCQGGPVPTTDGTMVNKLSVKRKKHSGAHAVCVSPTRARNIAQRQAGRRARAKHLAGQEGVHTPTPRRPYSHVRREALKCHSLGLPCLGRQDD